MPLGEGSCVPQNQTSICCLQPLVWPSQKIEFVSPASLETIRRKPRELTLRRPVGHLQDLAGCVLSILRFSFLNSGGFRPLRCCDSPGVQTHARRDRWPADMPPSCEPPQASLGSCCPSMFLSHRPSLDPSCAGVPSWLPPPARSADACCVAWSKAYAW